jgi:transcription initiation factor TFIIB
MTAHKPSDPPTDDPDVSGQSTTLRLATDVSESQTDVEHSDQSGCPECNGSIKQAEDGDEHICEECGLVVEADRIDPGPEWRPSDAPQRERTGDTLTETLHDRGLTTEISSANVDGYGNQLSAKARRRAHRLRRTDRQHKTTNEERRLREGLAEIQRMGAALGFDGLIRESAAALFRRAHTDGLLRGRSIESVSTASLAIASRQHNQPRQMDEFKRVSRLDDGTRVTRAYREFLRKYELPVEVATPQDFIGQVLDGIGFLDQDLQQRVYRETKRVLKELSSSHESLLAGKKPVGITAGAVYYVGLELPFTLHQQTVAQGAEVAETTVRKRYTEVAKAEAVKTLDITPESGLSHPFESTTCQQCGRPFFTNTGLDLHGTVDTFSCTD